MENQRECGECTACCKTHGVRELSKNAGVWCPHCNIGKGCKIYSERPKSCQNFQCSWLVGLGLMEYRPDKTGIVPANEIISGLDGITLWLHEVNKGSLESEFAKKQTRLNLEVSNSVLHIPLVGKVRLYLPEGVDDSDLRFRMDMREVDIVPFLVGRF